MTLLSTAFIKNTIADTFKDFPHSLMSVGKKSDDDTVSVFTKDGVTFHYAEDLLIACKDKCQFPCSHNCETRLLFSQNMPETIDSSPRRLSVDRR